MKSIQKSIAGLGVIVFASGVLGCALGDGRGFATADGSLTFELRESDFVTINNADGELESAEIGLVALQLSGDTAVSDGTEHRTSFLPVLGSWDPVEQTASTAFGPYEIDRGDYAELAVVVGRLVLRGTVGAETFRLEIAPPGGIRVTAPAALPVNREEKALITFTTRIILPEALLEGTDPVGQPDATIDLLLQRIQDEGVLDASWVRKAD